MSDNIKTWFDRIYLVHGGDTAEVPPYSEASGYEITWCKDNVDGNSIEYVRADLAATIDESPNLLDELEALVEIAEWQGIQCVSARAAIAKARGKQQEDTTQ